MRSAGCWLLILCAFFTGASAVWLSLDHTPPGWDAAWYLTNSLVMFDALAEAGLPGYAARFLTILRIKPPLITVLPTPGYLLLGRRVHAAYLVNLGAMTVTFVLLYAIGRRFRNQRTALLAVYLAGTMPLLYGLPRVYLAECSLVAIVCLTMYLVIRSLESASLRGLFWLGVTCGFGVLLKITFPLYVILPVLYLLTRPSVRSVRLWCAFAAPAILLPLPWYVVNWREVIQRAVFSSFSNEVAFYGTGPVFSLSAIARYLLKVLNELSAYYVALAAAAALFLYFSGALRAWWHGWPKNSHLFLAMWLAPFLIFSFGRVKDVRFVAPIFPVFGLWAASLMDAALNRCYRWKTALAAAVLTLPLLSFLHTSFGILGNLRLAPGGVVIAARYTSYARVYDPSGWPHRKILERIVAAAEGAQKPTVLIASDLSEFNSDAFELAAVRYRIPVRIVGSAYQKSLDAAIAQLHFAQFVMFEEGGPPEAGFYNAFQHALVSEMAGGSSFRELAVVTLPYGARARIYENLATKQSFALIRSGADRVNDCDLDFGNMIQLSGFAFEQSHGALEVRLRWRCLRPPDQNYVCFVHILDRSGKLIGQLDHPLAAGRPKVQTWHEGDVADESLAFPLAPGQTGTYHLRLGLYDMGSGKRLLPKIVSSMPGFTLTDGSTALLTPALP